MYGNNIFFGCILYIKLKEKSESNKGKKGGKVTEKSSLKNKRK